MTKQGKKSVDALLADSLKALAQTRPIEKITIREITDRAGVIRPTFYHHFQDKYELLEWIVKTELMEPVEPLFDNGMLREGITFILATIESNKDFYRNAARMEGQNSLEQTLEKCFMEVLEKYMDFESLKEEIPFDWITPQMVSATFANSLCYLLLEWLQSDFLIPVSEMADLCALLFRRSMTEVLRISPTP